MSGYRQKLIQLWNDWQLIAVVLLSLSLQQLLLGTGSLRRRMTPNWKTRFYFWALYVFSSPVAIYALGIISRASARDADADIQAFWAALLLSHLGGVDDYTALSLEDNKLWVRRLFQLSIQVVTTTYVFVRYFNDKEFRRFIAPFWLIFLAGLLKCVELVFALRQATMEELIESILGIPDPGPDYADTMDRLDGIMRSGVLPSLNIDNDRLKSDDTPVDDEGEPYDKKDPKLAMEVIRSAYSLFQTFQVLFADGIFSFENRRDSQVKFSRKGKDWAFKVVEIELGFVYDRLYTKASVSRTELGLGVPIRVGSLLLTLAGSLWALLVTLHASQYRLKHRCVTYTLLAGAVVTDTVILASHSFSIWSLALSDWLQCCACVLVNHKRWSGQMAQSNLISFCLKKLPSESKLTAFIPKELAGYPIMRSRENQLTENVIVALVGSIVARELQASRRPLMQKLVATRSFWGKYKQTKHVLVREELKEFIFKEIRDKQKLFHKWERRQREAGETLDNHNPFTTYRVDQFVTSLTIDVDLEWSLKEKEFEEILLIWHIATDLCFRQEGKRGNTKAGHDQDTYSRKDMAQELSNYLFYIMVVHPLMLSPPTTMAIKRCKDTCAEARRQFLKEHLLHMRRKNSEARGEGAVSEDNAHKFLLKVETPLPASEVKGDKSKSVLWDGCFLAKELDRIMQNDTTKKWEVMSKMWVEMLCYAAIHCGGYQHAERLKEGGELITFVCLLMTHLGMGKHYRTEVGDAYAHLTAYTAA